MAAFTCTQMDILPGSCSTNNWDMKLENVTKSLGTIESQHIVPEDNHAFVEPCDGVNPPEVKKDHMESSETGVGVDDMFDVLTYSFEELTAPIQVFELPHEEWDSDYQTAQLCVPDDNIADLEWIDSRAPCQLVPRELDGSGGLLSHCHIRSGSPSSVLDHNFGQESFSSDSDQTIRGVRSKRSRGMSRAWSSSNLLAEMEGKDNSYRKVYMSYASAPRVAPNMSSSSSISSASEDDSHGAVMEYQSSECRSYISKRKSESNKHFPVKPSQKKNCPKMISRVVYDGGALRRCSHCETTKTPQWRAGPHGPKTLCNACGVRFKSGRLVPEYRPAGSPGYVDHIHSNSHRKIMEMRRKQEDEEVSHSV